MRRLSISLALGIASAVVLLGYFYIHYFLLSPNMAEWITICVYFFYFLAAAIIAANFLQRFYKTSLPGILGLPLLLPFATAIIAVAAVFPATGSQWYLRLVRYGAAEITQPSEVAGGHRGLITFKNVRVIASESLALVGQTDDHSNYSAGAVYPVKNAATGEVVALLESAVNGSGILGHGTEWAKHLPDATVVTEITGIAEACNGEGKSCAESWKTDKRTRNWKYATGARRLTYVADKEAFLREAKVRGPQLILSVLIAHAAICFVGLALRLRLDG